MCAGAVPNVRLLAPPPGSRASAAAARRAAAVAAQRASARRSALSRRGASGPADRAAYATRAQLAAVDAAAKQLFPLSLLTGAAASVYYVRAPPNGLCISRRDIKRVLTCL